MHRVARAQMCVRVWVCAVQYYSGRGAHCTIGEHMETNGEAGMTVTVAPGTARRHPYWTSAVCTVHIDDGDATLSEMNPIYAKIMINNNNNTIVSHSGRKPIARPFRSAVL